MTTRTAKVILELMVDKYLSNAKRASQAIKEVGDEADKAGKKTDKASEQAAAEVAKLAKAHQDAAKAAGLSYNAAGQLVDSNGKVLSSSQAAAHGLGEFSEAVYKSAYEAEQAAAKQAAYAAKQKEAAQTAGATMLAFGTTTVAALGAATKAAMDWESAWAGVTKTVDGTPEQMEQLESGLRGLAKTLPITHTELAGVAEAAGQLGVKREDILKFTKTMVDLGQTTNLTAEEAATDIAQIANVMGTTGDDIDNFGAALVALGNDGASTEKDILSMAQRIAGAGKLVGATEADVLALSNTLASMGVKAELGGGVSTRVLLKMYAAVQEGGKSLDAFAATAGTSADTFAEKFRTSPVEALAMVTKGLGRTKDEGGNVVEMLTNMGMKGTEEMQVMLALAGAGDLLTDSLTLGAQAWEENTALIVEATKRYETSESKVTVAWNNIKDAAIDAGAVMLPVISGIAENITGLAQSFGDLPAPVQGALTGVGAVVGVAALAGGGLMLLVPKVVETIGAFKELDTRADGTSRGLGKVGKAAGVAAGLFVGFEILKSVHNSMQTGTKSTEDFTQSLVGLSKNKDGLDNMFRDIGVREFEGDIGSAGQALDKLINLNFNSAIEQFGATIGIDNGMAKLADAFTKADTAIAGAVSSGNLEMAAKGFKSVADSASEQGISVDKVAERFPNYLNALKDLASQSDVQVSKQELLDWAMGKVPPAMEAAAASGDKNAQAMIQQGEAAETAALMNEAIEKALEEVGLAADGSITKLSAWMGVLFQAGILSLSSSDAAIAYQASIDAMTASVMTNGTTLDINTEQGRANQSAYNGIAKAAMASMEATAAETLATQGSSAAQEQLQGNLWTSYNDLKTAAGQMGITGDAADTLARKALGIPKETPIHSWVNDKASSTLDGIKGKADNLDGRVVTMNVFENTHRTTYERRVVESGGNEPDGGGLYGSDRRAAGGAIQKRAGGGPIQGYGTSTSDEVPILASDGEHMLDRGDVLKMGGHAGVYKFRKALHAGQFDHLAGGGSVGSVASSVLIANQSGRAHAPTVTLEGLTVMVTNPFTGEQVRGIVSGVARQEAAGVVSAADGQSRFMRKG